MKYLFFLTSLALCASAGRLPKLPSPHLYQRSPDSQCCFGIDVNGGQQSGSLGQLSDGQNRVGPGFGGARYCLSGTGITDSNGFGCVVAMPQTQWQCDSGKPPDSGFSVTPGGFISYMGSTTFYECAATFNYEFNIYTTPFGVDCSAITLSTTSLLCGAFGNGTAPFPIGTSTGTGMVGTGVAATGTAPRATGTGVRGTGRTTTTPPPCISATIALGTGGGTIGTVCTGGAGSPAIFTSTLASWTTSVSRAPR